MKTYTSLLSVLLVLTLCGCGLCGLMAVSGSGRVVTEERAVSDFTGVSLAGSGQMEIEVGDRESLRIEAEDNLMRYLETDVRNGVLRIYPREGVNLRPRRTIRYYLTVRELDTLAISGSGKVQAPDLGADHFTVSISGSGDLEMGNLDADALTVSISGSGQAALGELRAQTLDVSISGSGKLDIAGGELDTEKISIGGSGRCRLGGLRSESANVAISGSGTAIVWATESLEARISGSGSVQYYGNPATSVSSSGSGNVKSLGNP